MTQFTRHTAETAPAASKPLVEGAQKTYGFLPNLLATMAESPAMLEGYMTLAGIFDKTSLTETERQIILMTNNRLNGCIYCMAAHTTISQMKGVPEDVITALRENTPIADAKLEALRVFAEKVNTSRGWPDESDVQALLSAGYSKQTVFDVILGTGLKVLSNYTNHVAKTPLDDAFVSNAWLHEGQLAR
ncbi:carboxymuconolactone decarboxylase family protein [Gimesia aquarii]|uniref:Carboxymuconolactone decarboxylase family protein n=1 Tax=Gimesia aquarii TaxID=2527964 RepID=A0A517VSA4_9PLAN|nr:carboxymuconolactone decarboxylase family protein [Gimesia aquarii]QDT95883.1 Carboxymuconolactone decarboxylase family protein [Gimesia aquarii]